MIWKRLAPLQRALRWHRRLLAAVLAAVAVYCVLAALTDEDPGVAVLAAARPVPGGAILTTDDLTLLTLPAAAVPEGALTVAADALGRTVVAPLPARSVLTSSSLTSGGTLVARGRVALPVTLAADAPLALLTVGDRVDLLGAGQDGAVTVLATAVRVVAIPAPDAGGVLGGTPPVILVDLTADQAAAVVSAAAVAPVAFALR